MAESQSALLDDLDNFSNLRPAMRMQVYQAAYDAGVEGSTEWEDFTEAEAENLCLAVPFHPNLPVEVHSRDPGMMVLAPDFHLFKGEPRTVNQSRHFDLTNGNRAMFHSWIGTWREKFPAMRQELLGRRIHGTPAETCDRIQDSLVELTANLRDSNPRELGLRR